MNLEASLHSLLSFASTLTRPTNFNLLRQILFSHTQRGYQFLFLDYFIIFRFFFFWYFTLLLIFTKIILLLLFYNIFFMKIIFIFACSGMFRNVPCSWFYRRPIPIHEFVFLSPTRRHKRLHQRRSFNAPINVNPVAGRGWGGSAVNGRGFDA